MKCAVRIAAALGLWLWTAATVSSATASPMWEEVALPTGTDYVTTLHVGSQYLFVSPQLADGSFAGLFRTPLSDIGDWEHCGLAGPRLRAVLTRGESDEDLLVVQDTATDRVVRSSTGGQQWESASIGLEVQNVKTAYFHGGILGTVYAPAIGDGTEGTDMSVVHYSTDWGSTWGYWEECSGCITSGTRFLDAVASGPVAWSALHNGFYWSDVLRTHNHGMTWEYIGTFSSQLIVDIAASAYTGGCFFAEPWSIQQVASGGGFPSPIATPFGPGDHLGIEIPAWDGVAVYAFGVLPSGSVGVGRIPAPFDAVEDLSSGLPGSAYEYEWFESIGRSHLAAGPSTPELFLAIWNQGLWRLNLGAVVEAPMVPESEKGLVIRVVRDGDAHWLEFSEGVPAYVDVFGPTGRVLQVLEPNGQSRIRWTAIGKSGSPLPSGVYFLRARQGNKTNVKKVHIVR